MTMTSFELALASWCGVYPMSASRDCRGLGGTPMVMFFFLFCFSFSSLSRTKIIISMNMSRNYE